MTPRDLLGVFVRLAGLGLILSAVFDIYHVMAKTWECKPFEPYRRWSLVAIGFSIWSLYIVAGARFIVRLAYWSDR